MGHIDIKFLKINKLCILRAYVLKKYPALRLN